MRFFLQMISKKNILGRNINFLWFYFNNVINFPTRWSLFLETDELL